MFYPLLGSTFQADFAITRTLICQYSECGLEGKGVLEATRCPTSAPNLAVVAEAAERKIFIKSDTFGWERVKKGVEAPDH